MAKETISQTEGLCKEVTNCIRDAYDRGYKHGFNEGQAHQLASDDVFRESCEKSAYEKGLNDAWECARKLSEMLNAEINQIFNDDIYWVAVFKKYSASEAIAKIKEYEEKQKAEDVDSEIKTGDEVIYDNNKGIACSEPFPVGIDEELFVDVWFGGCMIRTTLKYVKKTGKHYYHMSEILKQLKGE